MKTRSCRIACIFWLWAVSLALPLNQLLLFGRVLDNFADAVKTGWTDTLNGGTVTESGGVFTIDTLHAATTIFTASTKSSETFTIENGRTLEFRVDLAFDGNNSDSYGMLAWIPASPPDHLADLSGYGLAKSQNSVRISKGIDQYFALDTPNPQLSSSNVTLVLRLTGSSNNVIINARILDKANNNAVIYEKTLTDTSTAETSPATESHPDSYLGQAGNVALISINEGNADGSTIVFDNLQVFDMANIVLDDFNDNTKTAWTDTLNSGSVTEADMQFEIKTAPVSSLIYTASKKTSRSFQIQDGSRLEFSVDVVINREAAGSLAPNVHAFSVLSYIPANGAVGALKAYHVAQSADRVFIGKEYNRWWYGAAGPTPQSNVRLIQSYSGEGASVRINTRIEDLSVGANDAGRLLFQNEFLDSAVNDFGTDSGGAYTNSDGSLLLYAFHESASGSAGADVIYDNVLVNYAIVGAANISASISDISPVDGANFVESTNDLSFTVNDDKTIPAANIELFLNGTRYDSSSPGFILGGTASARTITYSGLTSNVNYNASIRVTDSDSHVTTVSFSFDTFTPERTFDSFDPPTPADTLIIESEDYNNVSGQYIDFISLFIQPESTGGPPDSYNSSFGTPDIDFHDTRTSASNDPQERRHRPDPPRNGQTTDFVRQKFIAAGGSTNGVYDYMILDIMDGEWLNYTKTFPDAGVYQVYLRQAQYLLSDSQVTLEKVTGDRTLADQTTVPAGSFLGKASGFEVYRNVPLIDAVGSNVVVRLSGETTLRVSQRVTGNSDTVLRQNYLGFIPAADPGRLRAFVADARPAPNESVASLAPVVVAQLVDRDTSVDTNSIQLSFDGGAASATVVPTNYGTSVSYVLSPLPLPGTHTNTLIFRDSDGVYQTNRWSFTLTYNFLRASNSIPLGSFNAPGWMVRVVQTNGTTLGNNLVRAEQQLAIPPVIPYEVTATSFVPILNFNENGGGAGNFGGETTVPGLPAGDYNNIALEAFAYLELTAGAHRFGAVSDDGFQLRSGASLTDLNATVLGFRDGSYNGVFDFVAETDGLYPARLVWYENGGGAHFELFSVDLNDPNARTLINDPNAAGAVKAWVPIGLASAPVVRGPFTFDSRAVVDAVAKTITVAPSGDTRFYRVSTPSAVHITGLSLVGGNVVITYE